MKDFNPLLAINDDDRCPLIQHSLGGPELGFDLTPIETADSGELVSWAKATFLDECPGECPGCILVHNRILHFHDPLTGQSRLMNADYEEAPCVH